MYYDYHVYLYSACVVVEFLILSEPSGYVYSSCSTYQVSHSIVLVIHVKVVHYMEPYTEHSDYDLRVQVPYVSL